MMKKFMSKKEKIKSEKGFTLMEVIVVIAIVAILVAISLPSITGYIERANQTRDLSVASNLMRAAAAQVMLPSNSVPPNTTIYMVWETGAEDEQGGFFVDTTYNMETPANTENSPSKQFEYNLAVAIGEILLGTEEASTGAWKPGRKYFYIGKGKSKASDEIDFKFSINSSTGEFKFYIDRFSSKTWKEGEPYVWFDEIGVNPNL